MGSLLAILANLSSEAVASAIGAGVTALPDGAASGLTSSPGVSSDVPEVTIFPGLRGEGAACRAL